MCLRFFQKWVRTAHPFKMTFLARKDELFLGRIQLQNWLASDHPGAYICMPQPRFGAKDVCYIEQKIGTKNATLGAASLYQLSMNMPICILEYQHRPFFENQIMSFFYYFHFHLYF